MSPTLYRLLFLRPPGEARSRHRGARRRSLKVVVAVILMGSATALSTTVPAADAIAPAVLVDVGICRQYDPNLVSGACVQYQANSGTAFTWIGTYRATDGSVFFCI